MAIGLGQIFGFRFPENFRYPYAAVSVTDFWRRWHISLSSWFRDYVYIPLGGNRVGQARWIFNLFVVWALTGIWHGANWTFLCWGLFYFVLLLFEKLTGAAEKLGPFSRVYTLIAVTFAWVMFRAPDIAAGFHYWLAMLGTGGKIFDDKFWLYWEAGKWLLLIACVLSAPVYENLKETWGKRSVFREIAEPFWALLLLLFSLAGAGGSAYHAFIYFNF